MFPFVGPTINYMSECLKWWDFHLKGIANDSMDAPKLRVFLRDPAIPSKDMTNWPGEWIAMQTKLSESTTAKQFVPNGKRELIPEQNGICLSIPPDTLMAEFNYSHGMACGEWYTLRPWGLPSDQQLDDKECLTWTTEPLQEALPILGFPVLHCRVRAVDVSQANMAVRLCDVFPDGRSSLISYGVLNLTHRHGHAASDMKHLDPAEYYDVTLKLHSTGYTVLTGHKLLLSIAPNYWPVIWPAAKLANLQVHLGTQNKKYCTRLEIPVLTDKHPLLGYICQNPQKAPPLISTEMESSRDEITVITKGDVITRKVSSDSGKIAYPTLDMTVKHWKTDVYEMQKDDPLSAKASCDVFTELEWPKVSRKEYGLPDDNDSEGNLSDSSTGLKVTNTTHSVMTSTDTEFILDNTLKVLLNGRTFFEKTWLESVPREFV